MDSYLSVQWGVSPQTPRVILRATRISDGKPKAEVPGFEVCTSRNSMTYLLVLAAWAVCLSPAAATTWTENSFADFRDGQFMDGGSNLYVSAKGRLQIINRWDLNDDGHLDILVPSGHGQTEKEDIYIYLNTGKDLDGHSRIRLPANGSRDGAIHDFNKDGYNDLVVTNEDNGTTDWTDTFVYFGGPDGFSASRRTVLPSRAGTDIAIGDLNNDGWDDLALACQYIQGTKKEPGEQQMSLVYWNSPSGFHADHRQEFSFDGRGAQSVAITDLDRDGIDDLLFSPDGKIIIYYSARQALDEPDRRHELPLGARRMAFGDVNGDGHSDLVTCGGQGVTILVGGEDGLDTERVIRLETMNEPDLAVADFDGDGLDDVAVSNLTGEHGATWIRSYVYYSDGKDFTGRGRVELPTIGAAAVSAGDLNGDGLPELVFSNCRTLNLHKLLSYVYWNDNGQFRFDHLTQLATQGTVANTIGDVNHDGLPDVVFFNHEGYQRDGLSRSVIYWGDGTRNFDTRRSVEFFSHYMTSTAHADLDDDGHMDFLMTQARFINGMSHEQHSVFLYWGSDAEFREGETIQSNLPMHSGPNGIRVADFNRDGYLDLMVGGTTRDPSDPKKHGITFYWGSDKGYSFHRRSVIPIEPTEIRCPLAMDFNRDGWLDLVCQVKPEAVKIYWGAEDGQWSNLSEIPLDFPMVLMYLNGADLNRDGWLDLILPVRMSGYTTELDSYIYFGSPAGFQPSRREKLATYGPYDLSVADFDRDGWLDLFLNSYKGDYQRNWPAFIYWGDRGGFHARPPQKLMPGYASVAAETADYDGDGWIDIVSANHRREGSIDQPGPHQSTTSAFLFWGDSSGFSEDRKWEFPVTGPHAFNFRDVGNSIDRGLYEDYTSSAYSIADDELPSRLRWNGDTPHGSRLEFQLRVADRQAELEAAAWQGPAGPNTWYARSGADVIGLGGGWIQYRARLISPNGGPTPYLTSVSIDFAGPDR